MEVRFHRLVQADLRESLLNYRKISSELSDDFLAAFLDGVKAVAEHPKMFHFDRSGLRRFNLDRFPYHFLYDVQRDLIRVWVLRHNRRNPALGTRIFPV